MSLKRYKLSIGLLFLLWLTKVGTIIGIRFTDSMFYNSFYFVINPFFFTSLSDLLLGAAINLLPLLVILVITVRDENLMNVQPQISWYVFGFFVVELLYFTLLAMNYLVPIGFFGNLFLISNVAKALLMPIYLFILAFQFPKIYRTLRRGLIAVPILAVLVPLFGGSFVSFRAVSAYQQDPTSLRAHALIILDYIIGETFSLVLLIFTAYLIMRFSKKKTNEVTEKTLGEGLFPQSS